MGFALCNAYDVAHPFPYYKPLHYFVNEIKSKNGSAAYGFNRSNNSLDSPSQLWPSLRVWLTYEWLSQQCFWHFAMKKHPVFLTVLDALIYFEMHKILIYLPLPYQLSWWYVFDNCIILYHSWEGLWRWWLTYGEGRGHAGMRLGLYFLLYYTALSFLLPYCRAFAFRIHRTKLSFWELGSPKSAQ